MTEWTTVPLGDAGAWLSGGTPSKQDEGLWEGPVPWVSPKDMKRARLADAIDHVSEAALGNGTQLAPAKSLLMVVRGMILAHTFPVAIAERALAFNQDVKALVASDSFAPDFLLHWLKAQEPEVLRLVDVSNHGTKRLPSQRLFAMLIPRPPLGEQKKIAAILSSVDDVIEATQAVIDQLGVLKKSMMAELLTRGLPGRHSAFKGTDVGRIPAAWRVATLADVVDQIDAGWSPRCDSVPAGPDEWGVLKVSAVSWGEYREYENKRLPADLSPRESAEVKAGDVLLSRANTLDLVGRCVIVRSTRPRLMMSDKLLRLRARRDVITPEFLRLVLETPQSRQQVIDGATGTSDSMKNISQEKLRGVLLPLPTIDEQERIAEVLGACAHRANCEAASIETLGALKSSLMSVLLTGEVRVKADEDAA